MEKYALISSEGSYSGGTQIETIGAPDDHDQILVRCLSDGKEFVTDVRNLVQLRLRTKPIRPDRSDESEGSSETESGNVDGSEGEIV